MRCAIRLGATLGLALVMWFSVAHVLTAQRISHFVSTVDTATANCHIQAITLTANLGRTPGVSDTMPYAGAVTRTVYVANASSGKITMTVEVSDFPISGTCYLWGGKFGSTNISTHILSASAPATDIVYAVNNTVLSPTLRITSSMYVTGVTGMDATLVWMTITRDITAPQIASNSSISTFGWPHLFAVDKNLYYAHTGAVPETFEVGGSSADVGAGLRQTAFSTVDLGCGIVPSPSSNTNWSALYCLKGTPNPASGVLTASSSDWVGNNAAVTFTYDLDNTPPTSTMVPLSNEWTNQPIALTWVSTDTQSGVRGTELWLRAAAQSNWYTATGLSGGVSGTIEYLPPDDGRYFFTPVAMDNLGNVILAPLPTTTYSVTALIDTTPPRVTITVPSVVTATGAYTTFNFHIDAIDAGSGLKMFTVTRQVNNGLSAVWLTGTSASANKVYTINPGNQIIFSAWAQDKSKNVSVPVYKTVRVVPYRVYLPVLLNNYASFVNGGFEVDLSGWQTGGQMRVDRVATPTTPPMSTHAARLGGDDSVYSDGHIPIGYGMLWQTFSVPNTAAPKLIVNYRVQTHDAMVGTTKYYDDFEISIDRAPAIVSDSERDARDCRTATVQPTIVTVPITGGLIVCDGNRGTPTGSSSVYDTGWRTVTLDLSQVKAKGNITLYLANWNRVDGYWNTWTYVDSIELIP